MGKAAEYLVAAACILSTRGELNVSTSIVDDEGVDLVFHRRDHSATLAVQVKSRMSDSDGVKKQRFEAEIRAQTFRPRADLDMLFVAVDIERGAVLQAWLVPSVEYRAKFDAPSKTSLFKFSASMKEDTKDQWVGYRLTAAQLAPAILARVGALEVSGQ
jgi:hypothetical protein